MSTEKPTLTTLRARALPLVANLAIVLVIALGMLWSGAGTDFKVHALIESIISLMSAFIIGVSLYLRDREEDRFFLIIALGFLGTWLLEVWHVFASLEHLTSLYVPALQSDSTSSWIAPRLFLATMLCFSLWHPILPKIFGEVAANSDLPYYLCTLLILGLTILAVMQMPWSAREWGLYVPRPEEVIPGMLFAIAGFGYLLRGKWQHSVFEFYLMIAIGLSAVIHIGVMPFSSLEFDSQYAVAHFLKFVGTVLVLVGLVLYGRDISRESLEDVKQRAETILQIMVDGIVTIDQTGVIRSINPAGSYILGLPEQDLIEKKLTRWIPGLEDHVCTPLQLGDDSIFSRQIELEGHRDDGTVFPLEATFNELPVKREKLYVGALRDISERKAVERERKNLHTQLKTALQAAGLGKWQWHDSSQSMSWDAQTDEIYGLPQGSHGLNLATLSTSIHPEDLERMIQLFAGIATVKEFKDEEFRIHRQDNGAERWISISGISLAGGTDEDVRVVGVQCDITPYKESVNEMMQARKTADDASKVKSAFLANMSHEIRTPMNGVVGMLDVLQQSRLNSKQSDMVTIIKESAFALLHLIDDILDFSKIEAGKLSVEKKPINIANVVESVCASLDLLAKEKGVELAIFADPKIPNALMGDSMRIRQVLVNLVNNAIKFSKDNTRTGKVSLRALILEDTNSQAVIEFQVVDNGIGMTKEVQDAVFDIFVQADSSTSRKFGGTGLGLTISKNLVEMMDGSIDLNSAPDQGSTFTVRFTMQHADADEADLTQLVASHPDNLEGLSCLLIEESGGNSADLTAYLRAAGVELETAPEVTASLVWLNSQGTQPRVCIIDGGAAHLSSAERKLIERENLSVVLVQRERRQLVTHIDTALILDGNALNRGKFLQYVGVAGKRLSLSPENQEQTAIESLKPEPTAPSREEAMRREQLILVAEDNPTNQQVVLEQLSVLGYRADIANNGVEALELWRKGSYSLLLTDLQMPVMDGYELTASVRAEETDSRIPIVALSADALVGEAEKSREIGMDDYLSKPARLDDLRAKLEKWLSAPEASVTKPLAVVGAEGNLKADDAKRLSLQEPVVDVKILEALVGGNKSLVASLLHDFRASSQEIKLELLKAWKAQQLTDLTAAAHKLKSSSMSMGAIRLGELCSAIELGVHQSNIALLGELVIEFEREVTAVDQFIASSAQLDSAEQGTA